MLTIINILKVFCPVSYVYFYVYLMFYGFFVIFDGAVSLVYFFNQLTSFEVSTFKLNENLWGYNISTNFTSTFLKRKFSVVLVMCCWSFSEILSLILGFFINVILFLILTIVIAAITVIERKVLSLVQRRVGPNYIGFRGRFQFIADAVKMLVKHIFVLSGVNRVLFLLLPVFILVICYVFWLNLIWGPSLGLCEVEHNLLVMGFLSLIFSTLLLIVCWISKNKYSILASTRIIITTLSLEIFLNFIILYYICFFESFSFFSGVSYQWFFTWGAFLSVIFWPIIFLTFFLETGRIPFDLAESESELIAGHTIEFGGFYFALFYLGEYFHLYCFSIVIALLFLGGWH